MTSPRTAEPAARRHAVDRDPAHPGADQQHPDRPRPDRPPRGNGRRAALLVLAVLLALGVAAAVLRPGGLGRTTSTDAALDPTADPAARDATDPAVDPAAPALAAAPRTDGAGPATGLDPELAARFAAAQEAAAADGVTLTLTSGRRTPEQQQELVDDALARYGDPAEAHRWVLPPETSAHVQGLAIDVGPTEGAYWLQEHGLEHGLCPTYANEVWHFEMLPAGAAECPEPHWDSSWGW
jgi:hypothetical protein